MLPYFEAFKSDNIKSGKLQFFEIISAHKTGNSRT